MQELQGLTTAYIIGCVGFQRAKCNVQKLCNAYIHAYTNAYITDTRPHNYFQGLKRHRGWTGNFYSVWQRALVWMQKHTARRCGLREHNVAARPPAAAVSPKRYSDNWSGWPTQLRRSRSRANRNRSGSFSMSGGVGHSRRPVPCSLGCCAYR